MTNRKTLYSVLAVGAVAALLLNAEVVNGALTILGTLTASGAVDFSAATSTKPSKSGTTPPATCSTGEEFFDTDAAAGANKLLCTATNVWTAISGGGGSVTARDNLLNTSGTLDFDPHDKNTVYLHDEFLTGNNTATTIGELGWTFSHVAGTGTAGRCTSTWGTQGCFQVTSGATSGNITNIHLGTADAQLGPIGANTNKRWRVSARAKITSTSDAVFRFGGYTTLTVETGTAGFGIRYDTGAGDTNFMICSTSGSADTCASTGTAADTNFHFFEIYSDGSTAGKVYARIDGGTAVTICSSGCTVTATPSTTALFPMLQTGTRTNAGKVVQVDKFAYTARVD